VSLQFGFVFSLWAAGGCGQQSSAATLQNTGDIMTLLKKLFCHRMSQINTRELEN